MKKKLVILSLVLLIGGFLFLYLSPSGLQDEGLSSNKEFEEKNLMKRALDIVKGSSKLKENGSRGRLDSEDPKDRFDVESKDLERLNLWINEEAQSMSGPVRDTESKELEIEQKAKGLKPHELAHLGQILGDFKAPANHRILSVFLLAKAGPISASVLKDYLDSPMPKLDPKPHSLDETRLMQEKAIRQMARQAFENTQSPEK